jgi:hypothetical protein
MRCERDEFPYFMDRARSVSRFSGLDQIGGRGSSQKNIVLLLYSETNAKNNRHYRKERREYRTRYSNILLRIGF